MRVSNISVSYCVLHSGRALCIGVPLKTQGRIKLPIAMANIGQKRRTYRVSHTAGDDVSIAVASFFTGSSCEGRRCCVL